MNAINWFEIPTQDLDRAVAFYNAAFNLQLKEEVFFGTPMAVFPFEGRSVTGCLVHSEYQKPSNTGTYVYLNAGSPENMDGIIERIEQQGGKVILPKKSLEAMGYIALFTDSEGNTVGLHAEV